MITLKEFITESKKESYNDEHAHMHIWNHMINKGISGDRDAMHAEFEKAKKDKKHPLHFDNIPSDGFKGKTKSEGARDSYHAEMKTAIDTVHALASHPLLSQAVKEKHQAKVLGAESGKVSDTWSGHGAKNGTSKADLSIYNPKDEKHEGIQLSMKKGAGSQLMSAGPEENKAVHDYAARQMLNTHPAYEKMSKKEKDEHHAFIMDKMSKVHDAMNKMKGADKDEQGKLKNVAQKHLDDVHTKYPELNNFVRREATTGEGKFGKGSPYAASFLVKSGTGKSGPIIKHVDDVDYSGPKPRAALPKGDGRSGNIKVDER